MRYLLLALMLMAGPAWGAELLVQAKDSPFEKGAKKGDVIVVRPDGWGWGKEECLPNYVVIKLEGVPVEDVKHYEEQLTEQVEVTKENGGVLEGGNDAKEYRSELVRLRKYAVPVADVDSLKTQSASVKAVASKDVASYSMTVKDLAVEKSAIALKEAELEEVIK